MLRRVVTACCAVMLVLSGCAGTNKTVKQESEAKKEQPAALVAKPLDDYTWDELSRISAEIGAAKDEESACEIANTYDLIDDDGRLTTQTKQIVLNGERALDVRLAGIWHDERSDGSGRAGLTFYTVGALEKRPMNDDGGIEGGWDQSDLRAWLNGDATKMLDPELAKAIVAVDKVTNNTGISNDQEAVTTTSDTLWLFSAREICGDIAWDQDEYQHKRGYVEDVDAMLNAEGEQYQAFSEADISDTSDPHGTLSLEKSTGAMPWWYRTPYPFDWEGLGDTGAQGYFYQVRDSGYPESIGAPDVPAGVVVGFCV